MLVVKASSFFLILVLFLLINSVTKLVNWETFFWVWDEDSIGSEFEVIGLNTHWDWVGLGLDWIYPLPRGLFIYLFIRANASQTLISIDGKVC